MILPRPYGVEAATRLDILPGEIVGLLVDESNADSPLYPLVELEASTETGTLVVVNHLGR